jgi:hypothetical protein
LSTRKSVRRLWIANIDRQETRCWDGTKNQSLFPRPKEDTVLIAWVERGELMPSALRNKMRFCTNKGVLEQHCEEEELSLAQLRQLFKRRNCQYDHAADAHDPSSSLLSSSSSSFAMMDGGGGGGGQTEKRQQSAETWQKVVAGF